MSVTSVALVDGKARKVTYREGDGEGGGIQGRREIGQGDGPEGELEIESRAAPRAGFSAGVGGVFAIGFAHVIIVDNCFCPHLR